MHETEEYSRIKSIDHILVWMWIYLTQNNNNNEIVLQTAITIQKDWIRFPFWLLFSTRTVIETIDKMLYWTLKKILNMIYEHMEYEHFDKIYGFCQPFSLTRSTLSLGCWQNKNWQSFLCPLCPQVIENL